MKNYKNNGKSLEKLVEMIQQALKNHDESEILSNVKLKDINGGNREIDVLIKSSLNGFELMVAIECKDYRRTIGIDKIDAFKAKCDTIPAISKKVFVTTSNYSSGARRNALQYGISLCRISELDENSIASWFPSINQLNLKLQVVDVHYGFGVKDEKELNLLTTIKPKVYRNGEVVSEHLNNLIYEEIKLNRQMFWHEAMLEFMKDKRKIVSEGIIQECDINFLEGCTMLNKSDQHIAICQCRVYVNSTIIESEASITSATSYGELQNESVTQQISVSMGKNTNAEIVRIGEQNYKMFIKNNNGELTQLSTLAIYDTKEDKLINLL